MSLVIKAIAILLLVSCTIAAPVEDQSPVVNVELPSNDDSAPIDLPSIEIVENDPLLRTKRQFGFGGKRRNDLKDENCECTID